MPVGHLYVNGFDNTYLDWTRVAPSPYLDTIGSGYVSAIIGSNKKSGIFDYEDTALTPLSAVLDFYAWGTPDPDLGYLGFYVYVYDGSSWQCAGLIQLSQATGRWYSLDVSSILNSQAKVNAARTYLQSTIRAGLWSTITVDCGRINFMYAEVAKKEIMDGLVFVD